MHESLAGTQPTTWANFMSELRTRFQPVTSKEIAYTKLSKLAQGANSVNAYVAEFRSLSLLVAIQDPFVLRQMFLAGLNG